MTPLHWTETAAALLAGAAAGYAIRATVVCLRATGRAPKPLRIAGMLLRWYWHAMRDPVTPEEERDRQTFQM